MENYLAPISIIIPTYNDAYFLERCLKSVQDQSVQPLEIIVVDDGSDSEDAYNLVHSDIFKTLNLKFLKIKNSGPSTARNQGHGISKGEFILFLDADDLLPPNSLKLYLNEIDVLDHTFFGICGTMKNFGKSLQR